ncbi:hypothetical protein [Burkholderia dolosa]|uniref:hypothetical protein n=1 Tax=Burkholderia dolosa TaxID=152500 RepID=UPI0027D2DEEE|nr:hypothetical protein [Burkholderia dolosa]
MTRLNEQIWSLAAIVESAATASGRLQRHAVTCGAMEAAGHLVDPGINTLGRAHRQGLNLFVMQFDRATGKRLAPHFNSGFVGLLIAANVPLDQLRDTTEDR